MYSRHRGRGFESHSRNQSKHEIMEQLTTEQRVAQTILQQSEEITVGDKKYTIAPPSTATLILVSGAVSHLPHIEHDEKRIMEGTLLIAKDCVKLGEIAATLILGAKHINDIVESRHIERKRHLWGLFSTKQKVVKTETKKERLIRELMEELTPRDLHNLIAKALLKMQVADFFGLTTFLTGINLMRPTKVETEATASGQ